MRNLVNHFNKKISMKYKVGQKVILPTMGATKIEDEGQEYWSCPENQVLSIIE